NPPSHVAWPRASRTGSSRQRSGPGSPQQALSIIFAPLPEGDRSPTSARYSATYLTLGYWQRTDGFPCPHHRALLRDPWPRKGLLTWSNGTESTDLRGSGARLGARTGLRKPPPR